MSGSERSLNGRGAIQFDGGPAEQDVDRDHSALVSLDFRCRFGSPISVKEVRGQPTAGHGRNRCRHQEPAQIRMLNPRVEEYVHISPCVHPTIIIAVSTNWTAARHYILKRFDWIALSLYTDSDHSDDDLRTDGGVRADDVEWAVFDPSDETVAAAVHDGDPITTEREGYRLTLTAEPLPRADGEMIQPTDVTIQVHPGVVASVLRDPDHADYYRFEACNLRFRLDGEVTGGEGDADLRADGGEA